MKRCNSDKGITLVVLIITIVVLFILASVTISSIREDGLLGHATNLESEIDKEIANMDGDLGGYRNYLNQNVSDGKFDGEINDPEEEPGDTEEPGGSSNVEQCEHEWDVGEVTRPAECTVDGVRTFACIKCGTTKTEPITATGHVFGAYVSNRNATCTTDGTKTRRCTVCSEIETIDDVGSALEHNYEETIVEPTCTGEGYTIHVCSRCKDTYRDNQVAALGHDNTVETQYPTCTEDGLETKTCKRCGNVEQTTLDKKEHEYVAGTEIAGTCITEGEIPYTCTQCGETYSEFTDKDPDNHEGEYTVSGYEFIEWKRNGVGIHSERRRCHSCSKTYAALQWCSELGTVRSYTIEGDYHIETIICPECGEIAAKYKRLHYQDAYSFTSTPDGTAHPNCVCGKVMYEWEYPTGSREIEQYWLDKGYSENDISRRLKLSEW